MHSEHTSTTVILAAQNKLLHSSAGPYRRFQNLFTYNIIYYMSSELQPALWADALTNWKRARMLNVS